MTIFVLFYFIKKKKDDLFFKKGLLYCACVSIFNQLIYTIWNPFLEKLHLLILHSRLRKAGWTILSLRELHCISGSPQECVLQHWTWQLASYCSTTFFSKPELRRRSSLSKKFIFSKFFVLHCLFNLELTWLWITAGEFCCQETEARWYADKR